MKISFIGYYGANFGDLLMLDVLIKQYQYKYDNITIFSYGDINVLQDFTRKYKIPKLLIYSLTTKGAYRNFIKNVKNSVSLNWGGGTCFMDENGTGGVKFMLAARLLGVKVNYIGIGIDKHYSLKTQLNILIATTIAGKLLFRDNVSKAVATKFSLFNKQKLGLMPDLAFGSSIEPDTKQKAKYVVFCVRNLEQYTPNEKDINEQLCSLTAEICKELNISDVVVLICDDEIDKQPAEYANKILTASGLKVVELAGNDIQQVVDIIANATYLLSIRLHPAVVAHKFGVAYSLYNYSDKNRKFTQEVSEEFRLIENDIASHVPHFQIPNCDIAYSLQTKVGIALSAF